MGRRVWRTADGRHVLEGHVEAAFLAYGEGDRVPPKVEAELAKAAEPKSSSTKRRKGTADKQQTGEDKAED